MTTLESSKESRPGTDKRPPFDVERIRADFPALHQTVHGKPLAYLDNAASAQKPQAALDAEADCYRRFYSNVHRGVHYLSEKATDAYEEARRKVQRFVNAARVEEMVFVRGTTEGINLVASTYGRQHVGTGDEVLITTMEHHSNIVPWQLLCEEKGARLVVAPICKETPENNFSFSIKYSIINRNNLPIERRIPR